MRTLALTDYFESFVMQDWRSFTDNFGDLNWKWEDGAEFQAGIIFDNSIEARTAEAQGVKSVYTIMTSPRINLEFQDVIRRVKDNEYYRITGVPTDDMPPAQAEVQFKRVSAEKTTASAVRTP